MRASTVNNLPREVSPRTGEDSARVAGPAPTGRSKGWPNTVPPSHRGRCSISSRSMLFCPLPGRAGRDPEACDPAGLGGRDPGRGARRRPVGPDQDAPGLGHAVRYRAPARRRTQGGAAPSHGARLRDGAPSATGGPPAPAPRPPRCCDRHPGGLRRSAPVCAGLRRAKIASLVWDDITPTARAGQAAGPRAGREDQTHQAIARTCA